MKCISLHLKRVKGDDIKIIKYYQNVFIIEFNFSLCTHTSVNWALKADGQFQGIYPQHYSLATCPKRFYLF